MFNVNTNATFGCSFLICIFQNVCKLYCVVPENIHTPHGRSREIPKGRGGAQRLKFPRVVGAQV